MIRAQWPGTTTSDTSVVTCDYNPGVGAYALCFVKNTTALRHAPTYILYKEPES